MNRETSLIASSGGRSQAVAIGATSAASTAVSAHEVTICATADCFMRQGIAPVALANGTDQFVPSGTLLRVEVTSGNKLAFITSGATGTVYITPDA